MCTIALAHHFQKKLILLVELSSAESNACTFSAPPKQFWIKRGRTEIHISIVRKLACSVRSLKGIPFRWITIASMSDAAFSFNQPNCHRAQWRAFDIFITFIYFGKLWIFSRTFKWRPLVFRSLIHDQAASFQTVRLSQADLLVLSDLFAALVQSGDRIRSAK